VTLPVGTRLGPYEVSAPLGAGGMGEVYRARDTRLGRDVAIKVLPAELSADRDRLARFEQEARSASALNHPHIVTIYDIGSEGPVSYMAMELVEGKSLRDMLATGLLPIRRVLQIGAQIAEGLARAHAAGIVHRDLKPENVMVTKDGFVKILDFGLAKLVVEASGEVSAMPTQARAETLPGTVLGTVTYMSPEQATGQPLDYRSDQFSLGSILYEMLTGKKAFQRASAVTTMAAIIQEEPEPLPQARPETPAPLRWLVERCLAKEARDRYTSTDDLARDLATVRDRLSEASSSAAVLAAPAPRARVRRWLLLALLPLVLLGLWLLAGPQLRKTASVPTFRQVTFRRVNVWNARFAPDGQTIVYTVFTQGRPELFSTRLGSRESRSLGISPANIHSISVSGDMAITLGPDQGGTLAQASLAGGAPREILEDVAAADWSPDGKSLSVAHSIKGKTRLEFPVGKVLAESSGRLGRIRVSPKGDLVAIREKDSLEVVDLSGRKRSLAADAQEFGWSATGDQLWFTRIQQGATQIFAVTLAGREHVLASLPGDFTLYDVGRDGKILVERGSERWEAFGRVPGSEGERSLTWLDATLACDLSADGTKFLFSEKEPGWSNADVYVRKTDGSPAVRLGEGFCRALSPDGKWVIALPRSPAPRLVLLPTGPGQPINLPNDGLEPFEVFGMADWLPDGKRIVFTGRRVGQRPRLFVQDLPNGKPIPISPEGVHLPRAKAVSPDGKVVIGATDEGYRLYPVEGGPSREIPGLSEEDVPIRWTADGALYVMHEGSPIRIWSLDLSNGRRRLWKEIPLPDPEAVPSLDRVLLTPDGRWYVHSYDRWLADLWVIEGVK